MSANNQTLIKQHKDKWYVFTNVNAESWTGGNKLFVKDVAGIYDSRDEAYEAALELDPLEGIFGLEGSEYGVQFNRLCKDDAEVFIID